MKVVCRVSDCGKIIYDNENNDGRIIEGLCVDHRRESNEEIVLKALKDYGPLSTNEISLNVDIGIAPLRRILKQLIKKRKTIRGRGYRFKKNTTKISGISFVYICVEDKEKFNHISTLEYDLVTF